MRPFFNRYYNLILPEDLREMLLTAYPLIVINVVVTGMQFIDAYMISFLGEESLAALLPAGLLYFIPISFGWGLLTSVNTFVSQCLGKNWKAGCGHYAMQALYFSVFFGLLTLLLWFAAEPIFAMMRHEPHVQKMEVVFFRLSLFGAVPNLILCALSNFFVGIHRPKILMVSAAAGTLLNILFAWALIFGKLGLPVLGIAGAAIGTALATLAQAVILLAAFWRKPLREEFDTWHFSFDPKAMLQVLRIGLPAGGQMIFDMLTWSVAVTWTVGLFGTKHLAANTIVVRLLHMAFMPPLGLGAALTAFVGRSIGEGSIGRAQRQVRQAFVITEAYMVSIGVCFFVFRHPLIRLFSSDPEVVRLGGYMLIYAGAYQAFDAMFLTFSHALRGAGDTFWPAVALVISSIVLLVGGSVVMVVYFPQFGSAGPWMACMVYVCVLGPAMLLRWRYGPWRKFNIFRA